MKPITTAFAGVALVSVLSLAAGLFPYAHPQADDLFRAARVRELGVVASVRLECTTWSGRWLGTGISYLVSSFLDVRRHYGLLLGTIALTSLLATYVLVGGVLRDLPRRWALAFSAALTALLWTGLPDPGDSFYWFTGAVENQLCVALGLALIGWLLRMPARSRLSAPRAARLAGVAALAFAIPGIHELYGAMLAFVLCLGALVVTGTKRTEWWVAAAACAVGLLLVVLAPGNTVRLNHPHPPRSLATLLHLAHLGPLFAIWIASPRLLAASLAFVLHPAVRRLQPSWAASKVPWRWLIPSATLALELFGFVACYWLVGGVPPRTLSALYRIFLLGWFATLFAWTRHAPEESSPALDRAWQASVLAFGVALVVSSNARTALEDLRWRAAPYDHAFRQRDAFVESAAERGDLHAGVPALPTEPVLFLHWDVVNDPSDFRNWQSAFFYRLRSLRVDAVTSPEKPYGRVALEAGHPAAISLLAAEAADLGDPKGLPAQVKAAHSARWMIGSQARIDFPPPQGSRRRCSRCGRSRPFPGRPWRCA
jgi:hypothetical protein